MPFSAPRSRSQPALVIPLGDPLMTLTDTIFIGQCAGTSELAAMGPPNIIFSFSQYAFQALQIAAIRQALHAHCAYIKRMLPYDPRVCA
jgi:hypothetical protein